MSYANLHLDHDEEVIMEVRKHWIVFVGIAISFLVVALLPLVIYSILLIFIPAVSTIELPGNGPAVLVFFYVLWVLMLWVLFFVDWTKYYLDVWYVTQKRIIAINQKNIFDRDISNLRFDKIQDITIDVRGFIPTMLDFGNVRVQTASEDNRDFYLTNVRHPERVRKIIFGRQNVINEGVKSSN